MEQATGFTSAAFGVPVRRFDQTSDAVGFAATSLGAPRLSSTGVAQGLPLGAVGTPTHIPNAIGFCSTQLGAVSLRFKALPIHPSWFGTPRLTRVAAAWGAEPSTTVSTAYYSFDQSVFAEGQQLEQRFGKPYAWKYLAAPDNVITSASGARTTMFGLPTAFAPTDGVADGLLSTGCGTPSARAVQSAQPWVTTVVGAPTAFYVTGAPGWRTTMFGQGTNTRNQPAAGAQSARFGRPNSDIRGTQKAWGLYAPGRFGQPLRRHGIAGARFGNPSCRVGTFYTATGWQAAFFGGAAAHNTYRARHIAPTVRFAKVLLRRSST